MAVTLKVDDEAVMLAEIERVRGDLTPGEFIVKCIRAGVRLADLECRQKSEAGKPRVLNLGEVAPEFANVDRDSIMRIVTEVCDRVKETQQSNPIYVEVMRLVAKYRALMEARRKDTGGLPIGNIEALSLAPIQHLALEVALQSVQKDAGGTVRTATKH